MFNLTLSDKEISLLKMSINHCLETCHDGGAENGCTNCQALEEVLRKINELD